MAGETNLSRLLQSMEPILNAETYVFCTVPTYEAADWANEIPRGTYHEQEGFTLILTQDQANRRKLSYEGTYRCITLNVHSSLDAVGLTAAVAGRLAENGMSANVIAAYYHDHVYISSKDADQALNVLQTLSQQHQKLT